MIIILDIILSVLFAPFLLIELLTIFIISFILSFFIKKERKMLSISRAAPFNKNGEFIVIDSISFFNNPFFKKTIFLYTNDNNGKNEIIKYGKYLQIIRWGYPQIFSLLKKENLAILQILIWFFIYMPKFIIFILKNKINIIRSVEPHILGSASLFLKYSTHIKMIQDVRGNFELLYKEVGPFFLFKKKYKNTKIAKSIYIFEKFLRKFIYNQADMVFGKNINNYNHALNSGAPKDKTYLIRIEVNPNFYAKYNKNDLRKKKKISKNEKIILFCSRFSSEKYCLDAIKAFERVLINHNKNIKLLMIGDGPEMDNLKKYVNENKIKNVIFTGYLKNKDALMYYRIADIAIVTFGGSSLAEAALSGKAIVAYDYENHKEIIKNNKTGLLVKFRDYNALGNAICKYLSDKKFMNRMSVAAKEYSYKLFNHKDLRKRENSLYTKLLK